MYNTVDHCDFRRAAWEDQTVRCGEAAMTLFLALMAAGLTGLFLMALPGLLQHGHIGHIGGHLTHAGHSGAHVAGQGAPAHGHALPHVHASQGEGPAWAWTRLIPSPRTLFGLLTVYGA